MKRCACVGIVLCVGLVGLVGCGEDGTKSPDGSTDATFMDAPLACASDDDVIRHVFEPHCASSACHDERAPRAGLDLLSPGLSSRLQDTMSTHDECSERAVVVAGRPSESFMLDKLLGTQDCGEAMPNTGILPSALLRCVADWIEAMPGS